MLKTRKLVPLVARYRVWGMACIASLGASNALAEASRLLPFAVGSAYEQSSGDLIYREIHRCTEDGMHCSVQYRDTSGALMATKTLDYTASAIAPFLLLTDHRSQLERQLRPAEGEDTVVDAGFDNFVRQQWSNLDAGETVSFRFQPAARDTGLAMRIAPDREADCTAEQFCLLVEVDSWLLRAIVDPIRLSYTRTDRLLARYSGISNLRDDQGKSIQVDIVYEYQHAETPTSPATVSKAETASHPNRL